VSDRCNGEWVLQRRNVRMERELCLKATIYWVLKVHNIYF